MRPRLARYEVFPGRNRALGPDAPAAVYYFRLVGGNGETQCTSEAYTSRRDARRGARAHRLAAATARVVEL